MSARNKKFRVKVSSASQQFGTADVRPQENRFYVGFNLEAIQRNHWTSFPFKVHPFKDRVDRWELNPTRMIPAYDIPVDERETTPIVVVDTPSKFQEMITELRKVNEFAIDLEMSLEKAYLDRFVCLLQISTHHHDFIVDPFTLQFEIHQLKEFFSAHGNTIIMHASANDLLALQLQWQMFIVGLIDTQIVYQKFIGIPNIGFEKLIQKYIPDAIVNKEAQMADWRIRPLPEPMLQYARSDTHLLFRAWESIKHHYVLTEQTSNWTSVVNSCKKQSLKVYELRLSPSPSKISHEMHPQPANPMLMQKILTWRDNMAKERDRQPQALIPDDAMFRISEQSPTTMEELRIITGKFSLYLCHINSILSVIQQEIESQKTSKSRCTDDWDRSYSPPRHVTEASVDDWESPSDEDWDQPLIITVTNDEVMQLEDSDMDKVDEINFQSAEAQDTQDGTQPRQRLCYRCNLYGHLKKNCTITEEEAKVNPEIRSQIAENRKTYLDAHPIFKTRQRARRNRNYAHNKAKRSGQRTHPYSRR